MQGAKLMYGPFEVNTPVPALGCHSNRCFKIGRVPGHDSGAMRMQDKAGYLPADRRWV